MKESSLIITSILIAWLVISSAVFSARNPWMTDMEMLLNLGKMLTFQKVDYKE